MKKKKQRDAEILASIESFDLDNYTDGAEMVEALFDRKEKIRSLFGDDVFNLPADDAKPSENNKK